MILFVLLFNILTAELYTEYFESGELELKGNLISGQRQGTWVWYNRAGMKWQEHVYHNGILVSEMKWSIYKPKAVIKLAEINITKTSDSLDTLFEENNVPIGYTGTWIHQYVSGNIKSVTEYMQGLKHGKSKIYRENGKLERIERYISGQKNGKWSFYDENENILQDVVYLNDKKNGRWSTYYPNGEIMETGFYKFDKKQESGKNE